jgi:hypothetical protein
VEQIHLWEVELNRYIINSVARMAAEFAANRTAREMEHATNVRDAPNWSFPSAFLYALSIVTTIGKCKETRAKPKRSREKVEIRLLSTKV